MISCQQIAKGDLDRQGSLQAFAPSGKPLSFFVKAARKLYQDTWLRLLALPVPLSNGISLEGREINGCNLSGGAGLGQNLGRNYIRPPPSPLSWAEGIFRGGEGGGAYLKPLAAGFLYAPPLLYAPHP